jgi:hypothetical protein
MVMTTPDGKQVAADNTLNALLYRRRAAPGDTTCCLL